MKNIDNLNGFPSYSVQNAVGCFNEFTNAGSFITIHDTAKTRKGCQLIAALQRPSTVRFAASSDSVRMWLWMSARDRSARFDQTTFTLECEFVPDVVTGYEPSFPTPSAND